MSETCGHFLGGWMSTAREMAWMYAPFVNSYKRYQLGSWAPTAILWSHDNRTCGFRVVGEHNGYRVESWSRGLHGITEQGRVPAAVRRNAYESKDAARVPSSLHEAIDEMERPR